MAKKVSTPKPRVVTADELNAHHLNMPKSRHGHAFAPNKVPPGFHTIIDPDKNPPQPWRDLPPATGLPPYRLDLGTILDAPTLKVIEENEKLIFQAVGDTGGVNTPTSIESVTPFIGCE